MDSEWVLEALKRLPRDPKAARRRIWGPSGRRLRNPPKPSQKLQINMIRGGIGFLFVGEKLEYLELIGLLRKKKGKNELIAIFGDFVSRSLSWRIVSQGLSWVDFRPEFRSSPKKYFAQISTGFSFKSI